MWRLFTVLWWRVKILKPVVKPILKILLYPATLLLFIGWIWAFHHASKWVADYMGWMWGGAILFLLLLIVFFVLLLWGVYEYLEELIKEDENNAL